MKSILQPSMAFCALVLPVSNSYSQNSPGSVPIRISIDTAVRIDGFHEAFSASFRNGDSLARYVSDRIARKMVSKGYRVVTDSGSDTAADWDIRLTQMAVAPRADYYNVVGVEPPALSFRVSARRLTVVDGESFSQTMTGSAKDFSLGIAVNRAVDELVEGFDRFLSSALRSELRAQPRPPRFLIHEQPIKYAMGYNQSWFENSQTWRLSLGRQVGQKIYMVKYSSFYTPHMYTGSDGTYYEQARQFWVRLGGGVRYLSSIRGGGVFWETDVNLIKWEFEERINRFSFTGVQLYQYVGYNYIGEWVFFSVGLGTSLNFGEQSGESSANPDNTTAPSVLHYPPVSPFGPWMSCDAEVAIGIFF